MIEEEKCSKLEFFYKENPQELSTIFPGGKKILHVACNLGLVKVAKFLINLNCPINDADNLGNTPLHYAAMNRSDAPELILLLINQANIVLNPFNLDGNTPLHEAVLKKSPEYVKAFCTHPQRVLTIPNKNGQAPQDIVDSMQPSDSKNKLIAALSIIPFNKHAMIENYQDVFGSAEFTIDKKAFSNLTKQFKNLHLSYEAATNPGSFNQIRDTSKYPIPKLTEAKYKHPFNLTEDDFILGRMSTIKRYLDEHGDPNSLLFSTYLQPALEMPLIFHALIHKQEEIFFYLFERDALITPACINKTIEFVSTVKDDSLAVFVCEIQYSVFGLYQDKLSELKLLCEQAEFTFQNLLIKHKLPALFNHYAVLSENSLETFFSHSLKQTNAVKFIYSVCSGEHPSHTRQFDVHYVNQATLGLLDQFRPEEILEMHCALIPKLNITQKLIGLYMLKQMLIFNIEFNYELSIEFERNLKGHLDKFYDSNLTNALLNLHLHIKNLRHHVIINNYQALCYLGMIHPSPRKKAIYEYINDVIKQKDADIEKSAQYLSNEFRVVILQAIKNADLKEFRGKVWSLENKLRHRDSPHYLILESRINAITQIVTKLFRDQDSKQLKANILKLFTYTAKACLSSCSEMDTDCNAAQAIYFGLALLTEQEIADALALLDKKTNHIYNNFVDFMNPKANSKHQRSLLASTPFKLPQIGLYSKDKTGMMEMQNTIDIALVGKINWPFVECQRKAKQRLMQGNTDLDFQLFVLNKPAVLLEKVLNTVTEDKQKSNKKSPRVTESKGDNAKTILNVQGMNDSMPVQMQTFPSILLTKTNSAITHLYTNEQQSMSNGLSRKENKEFDIDELPIDRDFDLEHKNSII